MGPTYRLLKYLADGKFHSGEDLADSLGVTRTAIWKQLKRLSVDTGLHISAVRGRGYRLEQPLELLDRGEIEGYLGGIVGTRLRNFWLLADVDSTNNFISRQPHPPIGTGVACAAEYQSAGRGRRGRTWQSPYGANLALSIGWNFDLPLAALSGLSLAVGVALAEVMEEQGLDDHRLKWPNDLHLYGRKLAGILVEAFGETEGPALAVVGVGMNLHMPKHMSHAIDQPWIDLHTAGLRDISRNRLAARVLEKLVATCGFYAGEGLQAFLPGWRRFDGYLGQDVVLVSGRTRYSGRYVGIRDDGALLLERDGAQRAFHAGEVSLRSTTGFS